MLDVAERGVDVVRKAAAVARISGTAGMEAAMIGKPVHVFGQHTQYGSFLPHAFPIRREEDIKPAIDDALAPDAPRENWQQAGARNRQAIVDSTFDLGLHTQLNRQSHNQTVVDAALSALIESLSIHKKS